VQDAIFLYSMDAVPWAMLSTSFLECAKKRYEAAILRSLFFEQFIQRIGDAAHLNQTIRTRALSFVGCWWQRKHS
jgi:uncharacterized membrane protein YbaN (DUF454 family)